MNTVVIEHLYEHNTALLNRARNLTKGDLHTAHDLVQTTYEKAIEKSDSFAGEKGTLINWLYTILKNTYLDQYRTTVRHGVPLSIEEDVPPLPVEGKDVALTVSLQNALDKVDGKYRALVWLCVAQGYTYAEASAITGIAEANVPVYVSRGKAQLAKAYKGGE
jgi:RNA polymerase sigma-70 factor, ECF subfamily